MVSLDAEGWALGEPQMFLYVAPEGLNPDGAVVAADGSPGSPSGELALVRAFAPTETGYMG